MIIFSLMFIVALLSYFFFFNYHESGIPLWIGYYTPLRGNLLVMGPTLFLYLIDDLLFDFI